MAELGPPKAYRVTFVDVVTLDVGTSNESVVAPAGTVTVAGGVAAALSENTWTTNPPARAAFVNVTVAVVELPPVTELGESDRPATPIPRTFRVAVAEAPPADADSVAVVVVPTTAVDTGNAAVV